MSLDTGGFPQNFTPFSLSYWIESQTTYTYPNSGGYGDFATSAWTPVTGGTTPNGNIGLFAKGAGGIHNRPSDGSAANGNPRGAFTIDLQWLCNNATQVARADGTLIIGGIQCTTDDTSNNGGYRAAGIVACQSCTMTGSNWNGPGIMIACSTSTLNHAFQSAMMACVDSVLTEGAGQNVIIGSRLVTLNASANGTYGNVILGGREHTGGKGSAVLQHGYQSAGRGCHTAYHHGANFGGGSGGVQYSRYVLWCHTFGGASTRMTADGGSPSANNIIGPFPNTNMVVKLEGVIHARGNTYADILLLKWGPMLLVVDGSGTVTVNPATVPVNIIIAAGTWTGFGTSNLSFNPIISPGTSLEILVTPPVAQNGNWYAACAVDAMEMNV